MASKAQIRASNKYLQKTYDSVPVRMKKDFSADVKMHLSARNESANSFFNRAAATQMAIDREEQRSECSKKD